MTGKYLGLASALKKLHTSPVQMNLDDHPATANLMIANPLSAGIHQPVLRLTRRWKSGLRSCRIGQTLRTRVMPDNGGYRLRSQSRLFRSRLR